MVMILVFKLISLMFSLVKTMVFRIYIFGASYQVTILLFRRISMIFLLHHDFLYKGTDFQTFPGKYCGNQFP